MQMSWHGLYTVSACLALEVTNIHVQTLLQFWAAELCDSLAFMCNSCLRILLQSELTS